MKTYQDLLNNLDNVGQFILTAIKDYQASDFYRIAEDADAYSRQQNTTINRYQKLLYTVSGKAIPDNYTANHKCASNFFDLFITQESQYLLGNGIVLQNDENKKKLSYKRHNIDEVLADMGYYALNHGVCFGFWNNNHVEMFTALEFVPLYDEEDGALKAGIRFWQLDVKKPLRATLYELDGYTEYIQRVGKDIEVLKEKRAYILNVKSTVADGIEIYGATNYPTFPIVPMWGNKKHQSELVGKKQNIDCYDLIKSGFANDLDDASMIYWTLENCGGMDDVDLAKFIQHMRTVRASILDGDNQKAEAHTVDVPYQSREVYLTRLEHDLYRDAQALDTSQITNGNVTATAIRATYQPLDEKTDKFEYCVTSFLYSLFELVGIDDTPTYKRNRVANMSEEVTMVMNASQYLDDETIIKHLPFITPEEVANIMKKRITDEALQMEDNSNDNN